VRIVGASGDALALFHAAGVTLFSLRAGFSPSRCGNAHRPRDALPKVLAMDHASRRQHRGHPMSRYIATTLLAVAAAIVTVVDLGIAVDQPGNGAAAFLLQP
jgi:hypothetical protein